MIYQRLVDQLTPLCGIHLELVRVQLQANVKQLYRANLRYLCHVRRIRSVARPILNSIMSAHRILHVHHLLCWQLKLSASSFFEVLEPKHHLHLMRQFVHRLQNTEHRIAPLRFQLPRLPQLKCHLALIPSRQCP